MTVHKYVNGTNGTTITIEHQAVVRAYEITINNPPLEIHKEASNVWFKLNEETKGIQYLNFVSPSLAIAYAYIGDSEKDEGIIFCLELINDQWRIGKNICTFTQNECKQVESDPQRFLRYLAQATFIHQFYSIRLTSSQEQVENSIRFCLGKSLPIGEKVDEAHQISVTFRLGISLMQPVRMLRDNVVLCATYTPEVTRFGALYRNESTGGRWEIGKYFAVADAKKFLAEPTDEQLIMLGFKPN